MASSASATPTKGAGPIAMVNTARYHIASELLQTEKNFVKILSLIVQVYTYIHVHVTFMWFVHACVCAGAYVYVCVVCVCAPGVQGASGAASTERRTHSQYGGQ